jgi:hypothetical protein
VVSGLERIPGGTIRVLGTFLDSLLEGNFDTGSVELNALAAPSTKWCVL